MSDIIKSYSSYVFQDRERIDNESLPEKELKKLRISGWAHQLFLAPLYVSTMFGALINLSQNISQESLVYGAIEGVSSFVFYSIYLRYGIRRIDASDKLKLMKKNLEDRI